MKELLSGATSMSGNTVNVSYPNFHYFAEGLLNGQFPLWDPYSMSGVPFYPQIAYTAFLDPIAPLVIAIGKFFTRNTLHLFHAYHLIKCGIAIFGAFLLLQRFAHSLTLRVSLILVLTLSSFILTTFQQYGLLYHFVWTPFAIHWLAKILVDRESTYLNWLVFAGWVGLQSQAYWFTALWITFFFILIGLLLFERDTLKWLVKSQGFAYKVGLFSLVVVVTQASNFATIIEQSNWLFPGRIDSRTFLSPNIVDFSFPIQMSYDRIRDTGDFSNIFNFLRMIYPRHWGVPSEIFTCLGMLTWAIGLVGIFFGEHRGKKLALLLLGAYGLTMLGPGGGVHRIFYHIYPPFWFIRNTSQFGMYFELVYLFFFILGFQKLSQFFRGDRKFPHLSNVDFALITVGTIFCSAAVYQLTKLRYPQAHLLFVWLIGLGIVVGILWKMRGSSGRTNTFLIVALSHLVVVGLCVGTLRSEFVLYALAVLFLPLAFWWGGRYLFQRKRLAPALQLALALGFIYWMAADLAYHVRIFSNYYSEQAPPARLEFDPIARPIQVPETRVISPYESRLFPGEPVSYPSLLYRNTAVFAHNSSNNFDRALQTITPFTHLQLKTYASLLRSGLSVDVLKSVFAVHRPLFEIKESFKITESEALRPAISGYPAIQQKSILDTTAFIHRSSIPQDSLKELEPLTKVELKKSHIVVDRSGPNAVELTVETPKASVLYWADGYDTWWKASIDGVSVPLFRANENFKAVLLKAGKQKIHFSYRPLPYLLGLILFYVPLALILLIKLGVETKIMFRRYPRFAPA